MHATKGRHKRNLEANAAPTPGHWERGTVSETCGVNPTPAQEHGKRLPCDPAGPVSASAAAAHWLSPGDAVSKTCSEGTWLPPESSPELSF